MFKNESKFCEEFTRAYLHTLCDDFSANEREEMTTGILANFTTDDLSESAIDGSTIDCFNFLTQGGLILAQTSIPAQKAGYLFYMNRNGHGVGFWDEDEGDAGNALSDLCEEFGNVHPYLNDDGLVDV